MKFVLFLFLISCGNINSSFEYKKDLADTDTISQIFSSKIYPKDWYPGYEINNNFLQDYSFAGYKNSEQKISYVSNKKFNVINYGADPLGLNDSFQGFDNAIKAAEVSGGIVYVPEGDYKISNFLKITKSNVVIQGEKVNESRIHFTISEGLTGKNSLEFRPTNYKTEFISKITRDLEIFDKTLLLDNSSTLRRNDDILIGIDITEDFKLDHSMKSFWSVPSGKWRPFFRRKVITNNLNQITIKVPIRYPLKQRDNLSIFKESGAISNCGIENLSISNVSSKSVAESFNRYHVLGLVNTKDCFIRNVKSYQASSLNEHLQSGGIIISNSKNISVENVHLEKSQNIKVGGNGYLFEITQSNEVLIKDSTAKSGRHNFIQNWDFNTNGCVFLRILSENGKSLNNGFTINSSSEFHHSLALANLIDSSVLNDGWKSWNRKSESSNSGHAGTQNVFWNTKGKGELVSYQFDKGYIIGTSSDLEVKIDASKDVLHNIQGRGDDADPLDYTEYIGKREDLFPKSLFENQLLRRTKDL